MIINPNNRKKIFWDLLVAAVTLYCAIEIPLAFSIGYENSWFHHTMDSLITFVFLGDIILNFFTGYRIGANVISDPRKIRSRYLKSWFIVDLMAAVPFSIAGVSGNQMKILRLFQFNRLLKLVKLRDLSIFRGNLQLLNPGIIRLILFMLVIGMVAHWIACGWMVLGGVDHQTLNSADKYSYAIYWAITTLTTVGYGDITPDTQLQRYYAIMVMIVGVGSYGYIIGNISSLLANMDVARASYRKKMEEVSAFLNYRSVPSELKTQVHEYYEHIWESRLGNDEAVILNEIPDPLRTDIALFMRSDLIKKVPFFTSADAALMRDLVMALQPRVYLPDTFLIKTGEKGSCMYIISTGSVDVVSEDESTVYATLGEGSFVGEMALVLDMPRTASVRTREFCDVYILEKDSFDEVLKNHPQFAQLMKKLSEERMRAHKARDSKKV